MQRRIVYRRTRNITVWLLAVGLAQQAVIWGRDRFWHVSWWTGWSLLGAIVVLLMLNWRKKLPQLPLGRVSTWLQWHLYVGLFTFPLYLWHTSAAWPQGKLEVALALLFLATFVSGLWGLYVTRTYPRLLTRVRGEFLEERLGELYATLARRSQQLVLAATTESGFSTLADYYQLHLMKFFIQRPAWNYRFWPGSQRRKRLMSGLAQHQRYLSEQEKLASEKLFDLIRRKDDLDFHAVLQGTLKKWLVLHVVLSYALVTLGVVHGLIAWRYLADA